MNPSRVILIRIVVLGLLFVSSLAWPLSYSATQVNATVVDADTGAQLEGVNVTIEWALENVNGQLREDLFVAETVTDKNGHFYFAPWGPREVTQPPGALGERRRLSSQEPRIALFKPGYPITTVANEWDSSTLDKLFWTGSSVRSSDWNDKVIKIEKYKGSEKTYMQLLHDSMSFGYLPGGVCRWVRIPRMMAALMNEVAVHREVVSQSGIQFRSLGDLEDEARHYHCPSARDILMPYLK